MLFLTPPLPIFPPNPTMNNLNLLYSKFSLLDLGAPNGVLREGDHRRPAVLRRQVGGGSGGLGRISILYRVRNVWPVTHSQKTGHVSPERRSPTVSATCFEIVLLCRFRCGDSSDGRFAFAQPRAAHHFILGRVITAIALDPGAHVLELVPHPQVEIIALATQVG